MEPCNWGNLANIATVVGVLLAAGALIVTACQVYHGTKISRAQFWLELEKMFSLHDKVHIKLRPGGEWSGNLGPSSTADWASVEDYMGLFEHCETLIENKLIDEATFRDIFSYRLDNILANKVIKTAKLKDNRSGWTRFIKLLERMGKSPD